MSKRAHLKSHQAKRIKDLSAGGFACGEIAERLEVSTKTVYRVLRGERDALLPLEHNQKRSNGTNSLVPEKGVRLVRRISFAETDSEEAMPTEDLIRSNFVDTLRVHYVINRPDPDRFLADLIATVLDLGFPTPVLKLAAQNFIRTRRAPNFPSVADCIVACRAAQSELRAGSTSNSDRSSIDSDEGSRVA
jgi:transposase